MADDQSRDRVARDGAALQAVRTRLQARAQVLGDELRAAEALRDNAFAHAAKDTVLDSGDLGEQRTREMVLSAEERRDADELVDIEAAIRRLDAETYGVCVDCGTDIAAARLQVQPAAGRCIACQETFERRQALQAGPSGSA